MREGLGLLTCKVLTVVLNNKTAEGAKCPDDFGKVKLEPEMMMQILNGLADDGNSQQAKTYL
jgi:hypothetical protein